MLAWLSVGFAVGVLCTVPIIAWASRRTERRVRRLEQRARAAERLAELGTLTGGLAHEIKNPLSTIGLNIQLLEEDLETLRGRLPDDASAREEFGRLHRRFQSLSREAQRLRDILDDFLRFAGRIRLDLQPHDLNALLDELADFFQPQASAAGVQLRTQFAAHPAEAHVDQNLIKQAVLNLMINAAQIMTETREKGKPNGGCDELILRTERYHCPSGRVELHIHVIDTGPGIDEQTRAKVFQPYFSTRKGGTGLGLPTTRRIVEEHGGTISVHAEPGRGSDFVIALPVDKPA